MVIILDFHRSFRNTQHVSEKASLRVIFCSGKVYFGPFDFELVSSLRCPFPQFKSQSGSLFSADRYQLIFSVHGNLFSKSSVPQHFLAHYNQNSGSQFRELCLPNWPFAPRLIVLKTAAWLRHRLLLGAHRLWHWEIKTSANCADQPSCHFERKWIQGLDVSALLCSLGGPNTSRSVLYAEELWELLSAWFPSTNNNGLTYEMAESESAVNVDPHSLIKPRRQRVLSHANPCDLTNTIIKTLSPLTSSYGSEDPDELLDDTSESVSSDPLYDADFLLRARKPPVSPRRIMTQTTEYCRSRSSSRMINGSEDTAAHATVLPPESKRPRLRRRNLSNLHDTCVGGNQGDSEGTFSLLSEGCHVWSTGDGSTEWSSAPTSRPKPALRARTYSTTARTSSEFSFTYCASADGMCLIERVHKLCYGSALLEELTTCRLVDMEDAYWSFNPQRLQLITLIVPLSTYRAFCHSGPPSIIHAPHLFHQPQSSGTNREDRGVPLFATRAAEGNETRSLESSGADSHPLSYDRIGSHAVEVSPRYDTYTPVSLITTGDPGSFNRPTCILQPVSNASEPLEQNVECPRPESTFVQSKYKRACPEGNEDLFKHLQALCNRAKRETSQVVPTWPDSAELLAASCDRLRSLVCQLEVYCSRMRTIGWIPERAQSNENTECTDQCLRRLWTDLLRYTRTWLVGLQKAFAWSKSLRNLMTESQNHLKYAEARIESILHPSTEVHRPDFVCTPTLTDPEFSFSEASQVWNDAQKVTEPADFQTALRLAEVIHLRLSGWFAHLSLLLMTSADSVALSAIWSPEVCEPKVDVTGVDGIMPTENHRSELFRLRSFIGGLINDAERLFIQWRRRGDRHRSCRAIGYPLGRGEPSLPTSAFTGDENASEILHAYPRLQIPTESSDSTTAKQSGLMWRTCVVHDTASVISSDTDDNIEELVSVTSRSSISPITDTEGPMNLDLAADISSSSEVTAHSSTATEDLSSPLTGIANIQNRVSTPFSQLPVNPESLQVLQPTPHNDMLVFDWISIDPNCNISTHAMDDDEQCNTLSTLKESSGTCVTEHASVDASRTSFSCDATVLHNSIHDSRVADQCETSSNHKPQVYILSQLSGHIYARLLQFVNLPFLKYKQNTTTGDTQDSLMHRDLALCAPSHTQPRSAADPPVNSILILKQRLTRGFFRLSPKFFQPMFMKVFAGTLFMMLLVALLPLILDWTLSVSAPYTHSSCSYRWFQGSWLYTPSEMGPQRTLSKSWPKAAPPF